MANITTLWQLTPFHLGVKLSKGQRCYTESADTAFNHMLHQLSPHNSESYYLNYWHFIKQFFGIHRNFIFPSLAMQTSNAVFCCAVMTHKPQLPLRNCSELAIAVYLSGPNSLFLLA